jgi:DNA polymerase-1
MEVYDKYDCTPQKDGSPEAFGIKYKKLRDLSKVIALASTYGATAHQLASTTGKSIDDTQNDIDRYFERFPGVASMMLEAHTLAKAQGFVTNVFGRPRRIPEATKIVKLYGNKPHKDLPYEARGLLNLAVNHRIQSTGASIVNRAAIKFYADCRELGLDCQLVVQVHDSMVVECLAQDAEIISILLQNAMENAVTLDGVALEAIPKTGKNLAEV